MKGIENIKKILAEHRDELRREHKIIEIEIFGSYIRGEQKRKTLEEINGKYLCPKPTRRQTRV